MNRLGVMTTDYEGIIGNKAREVAGRGATEDADKANGAFNSLADGGLKAVEEAARQAREEFDFLGAPSARSSLT